MERPKLTEVVHNLRKLDSGEYYCTSITGPDDILDNETKLKEVIKFYEFQAEKLNAN